MDGLCLPKAIHGVTPAIFPTRGVVAASVSAPARYRAAAKTAAFSRFSFRYPLRSLWPGGGRGNGGRSGGVALDNAVSVKERPVFIDGDAVKAEDWNIISQVMSRWNRRESSEEARNGEGREAGEASDGGVALDNAVLVEEKPVFVNGDAAKAENWNTKTSQVMEEARNGEGCEAGEASDGGVALDNGVLVEERPVLVDTAKAENWIRKISQVMSPPNRRESSEKARNGEGDGGLALNNAVLVEERPVFVDSNVEKAENWIKKISQVVSRRNRRESLEEARNSEGREAREASNGSGDNEKENFDRDSFSRLLRRVSWSEAELYAQMSELGGFAYCIPDIKAKNLLKRYEGLRFVTSSIDKREEAAKAPETFQESPEIQEKEKAPENLDDAGAAEDQKTGGGFNISVSEIFRFIAYAASLLHWRTSGKLHHSMTSSIDEREAAAEASEIVQESPEIQENEEAPESLNDAGAAEDQKTGGTFNISVSEGFRIIAYAASFLHLHTSGILPFLFGGLNISVSEVFRIIAYAASSLHWHTNGILPFPFGALDISVSKVFPVIAFAASLLYWYVILMVHMNSTPCEWYVCDDDKSGTRIFAIQGSGSISSWWANVLFDPIEFEGLGVIVHRGIYEAAKKMYQQMLPEIRAHKSRGHRATFRFTGHSLGGSLALLINLMLVIRDEVPVSSLLPVITYGAPAIMSGGDELLRKLGLPCSHVKSITMHRDIVPRAFSCQYPRHMTEFLKAFSSSFRNHPCLSNQNLLYNPVGDLLILQPEEKFSPSHNLLPPGIGLYLMKSSSNNSEEKRLRDAKYKFLNTPHPLDILGDRASYGFNGAVQRNHDMSSYLKCVEGFINQERGNDWRALAARTAKNGWSSVEWMGQAAASQTVRVLVVGQAAASQTVHVLVVVLFFPAKLLVMGLFSMVRFH